MGLHTYLLNRFSLANRRYGLFTFLGCFLRGVTVAAYFTQSAIAAPLHYSIHGRKK